MAGTSERFKLRNPDTPILFVDDDPIAHTIVRHHLKYWRLESVYSAREVLEHTLKRIERWNRAKDLLKSREREPEREEP